MIRKPRMVTIEKKIKETRTINSLYFHYLPIPEVGIHPLPQADFTPGQFFMVWLPHIDEIPISVSCYKAPDYWGISVKIVGDASRALCNLEVGGKVGIRGPLGTGFQLTTARTLFFGGGVGMAPLRPGIVLQASLGFNPLVLNCGSCGEDLLYHTEFNQLHNDNQIQYEYATEDGSCGEMGLGTGLLEKVLKTRGDKDPGKPPITHLAACGPEKMLAKTLAITDKYHIEHVQMSLERMMRCGMGICGLCAIDPQGLRVCNDGPVFQKEQLQACTDFGRNVRDFSGHKHAL